MNTIQLKKSRVDPVSSTYKFHTSIDVLRLDVIHPVISGNKWFKLKKYLEEAKELNKKIIATFGGAFSNHIVAVAAASKECGFKSIGFIRGERPAKLSPTLIDAIEYGMEIYFLSREDFKQKIMPSNLFEQHKMDEIYFISEGGYGKQGVEGAKDILKELDVSHYTHIIAAVGTGTMLAGLVKASDEHQKIIGVSVLKNNFSLQKEIEDLLAEKNKKRFFLLYDYHFGGYAKFTQPLIGFMNDWYRQTNIPSDFVYTGKLFFAVNDLIQKNYFSPQNKLLIVHSGGLQGNRSLPKGTLIF